MKNTKSLKVLVAVLGALAVGLGAFGAHGLKPHLDAYQTEIFNKAVLYHFIHLLAAWLAIVQCKNEWMVRAARFFLAGIFLFSGSLYLLATAHLLGASKAILGPITPLGGLCFIAAWAMLAIGYAKEEQ